MHFNHDRYIRQSDSMVDHEAPFYVKAEVFR